MSQPIIRFPQRKIPNRFSSIDSIKSATRSIKFSTRVLNSLSPCVELSHSLKDDYFIYIHLDRRRFRFAREPNTRMDHRFVRIDRGDSELIFLIVRSGKCYIDFPGGESVLEPTRPGYLCRSSTMENGCNPVLYANMRSTCVYGLMQ